MITRRQLWEICTNTIIGIVGISLPARCNVQDAVTAKMLANFPSFLLIKQVAQMREGETTWL